MESFIAGKQVDVTANMTTWGNSLAIRINKLVAQVAGAADGKPIHIHAEPGRIVIEIQEAPPRRLSLAERLASFDPEKHGGEVTAFKPIGAEKI